MNVYQYAILRAGKQAEYHLQEVEIYEEERERELYLVAVANSVLERIEKCRAQKTSASPPSAARTATRSFGNYTTRTRW